MPEAVPQLNAMAGEWGERGGTHPLGGHVLIERRLLAAYKPQPRESAHARCVRVQPSASQLQPAAAAAAAGQARRGAGFGQSLSLTGRASVEDTFRILSSGWTEGLVISRSVLSVLLCGGREGETAPLRWFL